MTRRARQLSNLRRCERLCLVFLLAAVGCNAILGNADGHLRQTDQAGTDVAPSITDPAGGDGEAGEGAHGQAGKTAAGTLDASTPPDRDPAAGSGGEVAGSGGEPEPGGHGGSSAGGMPALTGGAGGNRAGTGGNGAGGAAGAGTGTCASLHCSTHSTCDDHAPACTCDAGYELRSGVCLDLDECNDGSAGCDAHAACSNRDGGYDCQCVAPYTGDGKTCLLDSSCQQQQCDAHARCVANGCSCISGYEGDGHTCTRSDPCKTGPCKNSGVCTSTDSGFSCNCAKTGFMGTTCEEPIDDCASTPCHNGGVCTDLVNDYSCSCAAGWMGKQCDMSSGCDYNGTHYASGASFASSDGCNTCSCGANGTVVCTTMACSTTCGGLLGTKCPAGQYCNFPAGSNCGSGDMTGTCQAPPSICNDTVMPVCGCDGKTYTNSCTAQRQSISVRTTGDCPTTTTGCDFGGKHYDAGASFPAADGCNNCTCSSDGTVACTQIACTTPGCGGSGGGSCPNGQFCKYDTNGQCGSAGATGVCSTKGSGACPDVYSPVCGCDGKTYSNACFAGMAGVSVKGNDACNGTTLSTL